MPTVDFPVEVTLPGGGKTAVLFEGAAPEGTLTVVAGALEFALPGETHLYLSSKAGANFAVPPRRSTLPLEPDTAYTLHGRVAEVEGRAALWLIEYDEQARLGHHQQALRAGEFALRWKTDARCKSCCLALRLSGRGRLHWGPLALGKPTLVAESGMTPQAGVSGTPRTGPHGGFQAYSVFFDPAGYKPYVERHHRFYDGRQPAWYERLVKPLAGLPAVLEIGCGPGLLLEALRGAGVGRVLGLERDPVYLQACRERGLPVAAHDLNQPFPFVASGSFDGIVAHSALDYLSPIAVRTVLRECRRVLKPGGRLLIIARSDGQASGDETRSSVRLTEELMRRFLDEAGLGQVEFSARETSFQVSARRPAEDACWPTRAVTVGSGARLRPWGARQAVLTPCAAAWDNGSARDFTLLTTVRKDEVRVGGQLVAYYTGYHEVAGKTARAICRCVSADGVTWRREPDGPVLQAGAAGAWDEDGVAAGSVIALPEGSQARYVTYYSGRTLDGRWPGIGIAYSADGVKWEKQAERILAVEQYPGLRQLALADVIQTSAGRWLMHCEGWIEGQGWAVFQAASDDGKTWQPAQLEPVVDPRTLPWADRHAANPKCVEVEDGCFLLGFNAADASRAFELGLATSDDARRWRPIEVSPVICTTTGDYRIESAFMTRDAWRRGDRRIYFFGAATAETDTSSSCVTARADDESDWPGGPWQTTRWGLYRVRADQLTAEAGAANDAHALSRSVPLDRETQYTLRLAPAAAGRGMVRLTLEGRGRQYELRFHGDSSVVRDADTVLQAPGDTTGTAACLRVVRPHGGPAEAVLSIWQGAQLALERHEVLPFAPELMRVSVQVPPGEPALVVDHLDVWQPAVMRVEGYGDAHTCMGTCRSGDELLPDIDRAAYRAALERAGVGRALVMSYGSDRRLDSFDQLSPLTREWPGRIFPLLRLREQERRRESDEQFQVLQLELLWQKGLQFGLKVHMRAAERPSAAILEWLEKRHALTMWHAASKADLEWLEANVLGRYSFPVLLSHFGGYPLDRERYRKCIEWLDQYANVYLVTSLVFFSSYLETAIRRRPDRVLLGSDFPAAAPSVAAAAVEQLEVPDEHKTLVVSENLRFLTERAAWRRWRALREQKELLFPPLPETAAEVAAQGFEVVDPAQIAPEEDAHAKGFWSQHVSPFYVEHKPWATMVAEWARHLGARSVLEFGCHVGRNLAAIREVLPDCRLLGLDINAEAVRAGRERNELDLRCGNEQMLAEFGDGAFDFVFTVSVLDHIPDIARVCQELVRVAARAVLFLEVTLPVEGKVLRHFDHKAGAVRTSTEASYSWFVDRHLAGQPRIWRLDCRPYYLHSASLGPYYWAYLAFLEEPRRPA